MRRFDSVASQMRLKQENYMKKTSFLAAFSLLTAVLLASCATTRAYVEGIDDYEKQEIGTKGNRFFLNDANTVS